MKKQIGKKLESKPVPAESKKGAYLDPDNISLPDGYSEATSDFNWWKPKGEVLELGETIAGTVCRVLDMKDGGRRIILDCGSDVGEIGLPNHATLMSKLHKIRIGDDLMITVTHVGTGRGDLYEYKVGIKKAG